MRPDYRSLFSAQHGGAFDLMHDIDLALWYAGLPVRQVSCAQRQLQRHRHRAPDVAEILIGFEGRDHDRCLATVHLDFFQRPRRRQIELIGTGGVIIVEFASLGSLHGVRSTRPRGSSGTHEEMVTDRDDMFRAEDREFLQAVADDQPIRCTIAEARKSVEVVLACQK